MALTRNDRIRRRWAQRVAGEGLRLVRNEPFPELRDPEGQLHVWMDQVEFSQVVAILESIQPRTVLEWGAGGSTRGFLARSPFIQRWVSIEHNAGWVGEVRKAVKDPRLELHLVEPTEPEPPPAKGSQERHLALEAWHLRAETDKQLFADYVGLPRKLGVRPDFILVDGRARIQCIAEGFELLNPGGVLVLHDAQRTEYHATMHGLGRATFLVPWFQGQIAMLRKPVAG